MNSSTLRGWLKRGKGAAFGLVALAVFIAGCATPEQLADIAGAPYAPQGLNPGDVLKISFPETPTLEAASPPQTIRRDGKINLVMVGEIMAAGKTPTELEKELVEAYSTQVVAAKDIKVVVVQSAFSVYVTGAVVRPGKVVTPHALNVYEAIMEAGGPIPNANLKEVLVTRLEDGKHMSRTLDLRPVFAGKPSEPFYLKPYDTVKLVTKFSMF